MKDTCSIFASLIAAGIDITVPTNIDPTPSMVRGSEIEGLVRDQLTDIIFTNWKPLILDVPGIEEVIETAPIREKPKAYEYSELRSPVTYPVGKYINGNIDIIKTMAECLIRTFPEAQDSKPVNLICSGSSGAIIAAIVATMVYNPVIVHVKKSEERAHYMDCPVRYGCLNIVVDDHVCTTMRYIARNIQERNGSVPIHALLVGGGVNGRKMEDAFNGLLQSIICYSVY